MCQNLTDFGFQADKIQLAPDHMPQPASLLQLPTALPRSRTRALDTPRSSAEQAFKSVGLRSAGLRRAEDGIRVGAERDRPADKLLGSHFRFGAIQIPNDGNSISKFQISKHQYSQISKIPF